MNNVYNILIHTILAILDAWQNKLEICMASLIVNNYWDTSKTKLKR